jgi:hypothetical protein
METETQIRYRNRSALMREKFRIFSRRLRLPLTFANIESRLQNHSGKSWNLRLVSGMWWAENKASDGGIARRTSFSNPSVCFEMTR